MSATRTPNPTPPARCTGRRTGRRTPLRLAALGALGAGLVLATGPLLLAPTPAWAQSADELRDSGRACERPDGLLKALDATVAGAVETINRQRLATYQQIAEQQGGTVKQVRIVSGEKLQAKYGGCP